MGADTNERTELPPPRYEYGADDWIFVELAQEMSLDANFKTMAITNRMRERELPGVSEICPANASYMHQFDTASFGPSKTRSTSRSTGGRPASSTCPSSTMIPGPGRSS